jgi:hypothetical protein
MPKPFHQHRGQIERTIRRAGELARMLRHMDQDQLAKDLLAFRWDVLCIAAAFAEIEYRHSKTFGPEIACPICGEVFEQYKPSLKYCSPKCRQKAYRQRVTEAGKALTCDASHVTDARERVSGDA